MLTLKREGQTWTATFSNGFLFNERATGASEIAALRNLARGFVCNRKQTPVIKEMIRSIGRIAKAKLEGRAIPRLYGAGINLAEY